VRLAFIYNARSFTNAQYRALMPMAVLKARGHEVVWFGSTDDKLPVERLRACDLIHVYRAADASLLKALASLQADGVVISWDNDDDVTAISEHSPSYRQLGGLKGAQDFQRQTRAIQLADIVTTTSRALASKFTEVGARDVEIIENYLPPEFARTDRSHKRDDSVVIGWAALREHEADLLLLSLRPALREVLDAHPRVRLVSVGLDLGIEHSRCETRKRVAFEELPITLGEFDIGIAPLADIAFNRARSNVKLKEYAIAGVPWLASPVGEYASMGARQGGQLVKQDDWADALSALIHSGRKRMALRARGRLWARRQTIDLHIHRWEKVFEQAVTRKKKAERRKTT
jgi:glycosyltransferase involved in cell wall biosynthesis